MRRCYNAVQVFSSSPPLLSDSLPLIRPHVDRSLEIGSKQDFPSYAFVFCGVDTVVCWLRAPWEGEGDKEIFTLGRGRV